MMSLLSHQQCQWYQLVAVWDLLRAVVYNDIVKTRKKCHKGQGAGHESYIAPSVVSVLVFSIEPKPTHILSQPKLFVNPLYA